MPMELGAWRWHGVAAIALVVVAIAAGPAGARQAAAQATAQVAGVLEQFETTLGPGGDAATRRVAPAPAAMLPEPLSEQSLLSQLERPGTHPQLRRAQALRGDSLRGTLARPFGTAEAAGRLAQRAAAQATGEYGRYYALARALPAAAGRAARTTRPATVSKPPGAPDGASALGRVVGADRAAALPPGSPSRGAAVAGALSLEERCAAVARLWRVVAPPTPAASGVPALSGPRAAGDDLSAALDEGATRDAAGGACARDARRLRAQALELQGIFGALGGWLGFDAAVIVPLLAPRGEVRTPPGRIRYLGH